MDGQLTSTIDQTDERVVHAMKTLHPDKYENLLTDNGSQFLSKNYRMKDYCENSINGRHIWTSVHHPQTMGKHAEGIEEVPKAQAFYNNATTVSTTRSVPAERYYGFIDEGWYTRLVKMLKLESVLPIDHAPEGVT